MSGSIHRFVREPLLHFVLAGSILFIAGELHRRHVDPYRIVVTPQREALLATRYALQFGARPDEATLAQLVRHDVEEEMLFRRGLALELDQNDEIVRRRIVQKMQFLLQDLDAPAEPDDAQLAAYYRAHSERYAEPLRVTFSHIFFHDAGDQDAARQRAAAALDQLRRGSDPRSLGDPFPDRYHFSSYEPQQVARLFGRTELAAAVLSAPLDRWAGPHRSSYGWHLLHVSVRQQARQLELATVRDKVRTDFLLDAQARSNTAAFDRLAREFDVVRDPS